MLPRKNAHSDIAVTYTGSSLEASPNDTTFSSNWTTPLLCINAGPGAQGDVGFTASGNETYVTTGWDFYGRQLLWDGTANSSVGAGRSFWASPMSALEGGDGFYKLIWNADNALLNGSVPVAIKRLPPPGLED